MLEKLSERVKSLSTYARLAKALWKSRHDPELERVFRSYRSGVPLAAIIRPGLLARQLPRRPTPFRNPLQQPHQFYMPDLPSAPFLKQDEISRLLVANLGMIRAEYAAYSGDETPSPSERLVDAGRWSTVPLMRSEGVFAENVARFPATWALMRRLPLLPSPHGGIYFSVLDPSTHISPHCGPSNLRLRYHLTIADAAGARIRCGTEWRGWEENGCLLLDDSFEHEVRHEGSRRRVVLIVDCWHPELTLSERLFLGELYNAWFPHAGWITRPDLEGAAAGAAQPVPRIENGPWNVQQAPS